MTLRVGILTYDFVPFIGGQGRVTWDLFRHLRARPDVEVIAISPSRNNIPGHHERFSATQRVGRHVAFSILASREIGAWCRELGVDVLHVNSGPGGVLLLGDPHVPVVCWPHHTYEQAARLMPGSAARSVARIVERAAYLRASVLACTTASVEASLRFRLGLNLPLERIPCGLDTEAFPIGTGGRHAEEILFVGRLERRKQPGLLLDAFVRVVARHPSARLVFVGEGPLEEQLRRHAAARRVAASVVFDRFVDHAALVERYQRAAMVVVPSTFEGFGLTAIEAASCGACVVATNTEGLRDVVIDGETGVLAEPSAGALSDAICALLEADASRQAIGARAGAYVRDTYAWPRIADAWAKAYWRAAGRGDARQPSRDDGDRGPRYSPAAG